jgi:hypothetical protein
LARPESIIRGVQQVLQSVQEQVARPQFAATRGNVSDLLRERLTSLDIPWKDYSAVLGTDADAKARADAIRAKVLAGE